MITKQRIGNELYIFHNGQLVYKRWYTRTGNKAQPSLLHNVVWPNEWIV